MLLLDECGNFPAPKKPEKRYATVDFTLISDDVSTYTKTYVGSLHADDGENNTHLKVRAEEMVECFANGEFVGVSLWNTHEFNLAKHLKKGENKLMLKVTGNAANRYTNHKIEYGLLPQA